MTRPFEKIEIQLCYFVLKASKSNMGLKWFTTTLYSQNGWVLWVCHRCHWCMIGDTPIGLHNSIRLIDFDTPGSSFYRQIKKVNKFWYKSVSFLTHFSGPWFTVHGKLSHSLTHDSTLFKIFKKTFNLLNVRFKKKLTKILHLITLNITEFRKILFSLTWFFLINLACKKCKTFWDKN